MAKVVLENVRIDFPIYGAQQRSLRTTIVQRATGGLIHREGRHKERVFVRALSDVSLRLEEGDRLGLVGHNGAGKSTLLKVIAGIYEPVAGTRIVEGRVTPLFDMMPGLDPEDNGYENIRTAGLLLGMSREQVESKIPEVEEFCELGEYLTLPVRTYSAGMVMRLGFALVTALEPGVLLMDEGFGTGDLRFTERATKRMDEFMGRSRIIVLASHSESKIRSICNKAALMEEGRLVAIGLVDDIYDRYKAIEHVDAEPAAVATLDSTPAYPAYCEESIREVGLADRRTRASGAVRFTKAAARDQSGRTRWNYAPGETVTFHFEYEVLEPVPDLAFLFRLFLPDDFNSQQPSLSWAHMVTDCAKLLSSDPIEAGRKGAVEVVLPCLRLKPNRFLLYVCLMHADGYPSHDVIDTNVGLPALSIESEARNSELRGVVSLDHEIRKIDFNEPMARAVIESEVS